jgi:hypothetical protein
VDVFGLRHKNKKENTKIDEIGKKRRSLNRRLVSQTFIPELKI